MPTAIKDQIANHFSPQTRTEKALDQKNLRTFEQFLSNKYCPTPSAVSHAEFCNSVEWKCLTHKKNLEFQKQTDEFVL